MITEPSPGSSGEPVKDENNIPIKYSFDSQIGVNGFNYGF